MPSQPSDQSDIELLCQVAEGNRDAFARLYDRFAGCLFSLAVRMLGEPKEAEDVLQEVFLAIWEKAGSYDPKLGKPLSWAVTLTRNRAIDRLRSAQRRSRLLEEAAVTGIQYSGGACDLIRAEDAARVRIALEQLSADQRRAIELAFFGGLSQTEIAAELKEPLGTVKARIRRGMIQLRDSLGKVL